MGWSWDQTRKNEVTTKSPRFDKPPTAISGAVFSIEVFESSLVLWKSDESGVGCASIYVPLLQIDVIVSLLSGRLVRERIGPAMLSAVQSQGEGGAGGGAVEEEGGWRRRGGVLTPTISPPSPLSATSGPHFPPHTPPPSSPSPSGGGISGGGGSSGAYANVQENDKGFVFEVKGGRKAKLYVDELSDEFVVAEGELSFFSGLVFGEYLLSGLVPSVKEVNDEEPFFPALPLLSLKPTNK
ncbi:hypothetical protein Tco_0898680, partial [Tanacetum coccineum]